MTTVKVLSQGSSTKSTREAEGILMHHTDASIAALVPSAACASTTPPLSGSTTEGWTLQRHCTMTSWVRLGTSSPVTLSAQATHLSGKAKTI